ncbi:MAG: 2OG-Fe(II) oxygenase [Parvularculaceae bacterium]
MSEPTAGFQLIASGRGAFSDAEMKALVEHCNANAGEGVLSGGLQSDSYRRSSVAWASRDDGFEWLYERLATLARGVNAQFFGFDIDGIESAAQIARYDAETAGTYDWHTDFGIGSPRRKLSISVQLTDGADYDGGDLEFDVSSEATKAGRERGIVVAFPSFVRHRVAPVTRGTRYSLVAWISGPRWR